MATISSAATGGIMLTHSYSHLRSKKPQWTVAILIGALIALGSIGSPTLAQQAPDTSAHQVTAADQDASQSTPSSYTQERPTTGWGSAVAPDAEPDSPIVATEPEDEAPPQQVEASEIDPQARPVQQPSAAQEQTQAQDQEQSQKRMALIVLAILGLLYFVPSVMALLRGHPYTRIIVTLNIFIGWTFVGWLACLVWSIWPLERAAGEALLAARATDYPPERVQSPGVPRTRQTNPKATAILLTALAAVPVLALIVKLALIVSERGHIREERGQLSEMAADTKAAFGVTSKPRPVEPDDLSYNPFAEEDAKLSPEQQIILFRELSEAEGPTDIHTLIEIEGRRMWLFSRIRATAPSLLTPADRAAFSELQKSTLKDDL